MPKGPRGRTSALRQDTQSTASRYATPAEPGTARLGGFLRPRNWQDRGVAFDERDRRIVAALVEDGRATYAEIGARVGLSAPAVKRSTSQPAPAPTPPRAGPAGPPAWRWTRRTGRSSCAARQGSCPAPRRRPVA